MSRQPLGRPVAAIDGGPHTHTHTHLTNSNRPNSALRRLDQPAPTMFFGHNSNWCAWVTP